MHPGKLVLLCLLLGFGVTLIAQPATGRGSRSSFRKARRLYRLGNKLARKGRYRSAIGRFRSVLRLLRGNSRRAIRARWEALFRIAVLNQRLRKFRISRAQLEQLWQSSPSPAQRFHRRLDRQFTRLSRQLLPELQVTVSPTHTSLEVKDITGLLRPRKITTSGNQRIYHFDAQAGPVELLVHAVGYTPLSQKLNLRPARLTQTSLSLSKLTGLDLPKALIEESKQQQKNGSLVDAHETLARSKRALMVLPSSSRRNELLWWVNLSLGQQLVALSKDDKARAHFSLLWNRYPGEGQRRELTRLMCLLTKERGWTPPILQGFVGCQKKPPVSPRPTTTVENLPTAGTWVLWGVGLVGIAGGAVFLGLGEIAHTQRDALTPGTPTHDKQDTLYFNYIVATWISFGVGGVSAVAGLIVYLAHDRGRVIKKTHIPNLRSPLQATPTNLQSLYPESSTTAPRRPLP